MFARAGMPESSWKNGAPPELSLESDVDEQLDAFLLKFIEANDCLDNVVVDQSKSMTTAKTTTVTTTTTSNRSTPPIVVQQQQQQQSVVVKPESTRSTTLAVTNINVPTIFDTEKQKKVNQSTSTTTAATWIEVPFFKVAEMFQALVVVIVVVL
jgi:hypothetical protein